MMYSKWNDEVTATESFVRTAVFVVVVVVVFEDVEDFCACEEVATTSFPWDTDFALSKTLLFFAEEAKNSPKEVGSTN